ncbi:Hsp20 family protein [Sphingomonas crocodyli]|uniref:Hsp20 family protein n=2 Tax=Sphingomonas crocodyli TaxID=1979270 RepID=A0A437LYP2_9SPHN|nr:Hsp20 family protein [Sphingomonas crocodyli]
MLEGNVRNELGDPYPPFDLEKIDNDSFRITLALAGFSPDEVEITAEQNQLVVVGRKRDEAGTSERYLHRGIAARPFERRFQLADFIEVRSATFENGLLTIALKREIPEAMKPRKIEIGAPANDGGRLPQIKQQAEA